MHVYRYLAVLNADRKGHIIATAFPIEIPRKMSEWNHRSLWFRIATRNAEAHRKLGSRAAQLWRHPFACLHSRAYVAQSAHQHAVADLRAEMRPRTEKHALPTTPAPKQNDLVLRLAALRGGAVKHLLPCTLRRGACGIVPWLTKRIRVKPRQPIALLATKRCRKAGAEVVTRNH